MHFAGVAAKTVIARFSPYKVYSIYMNAQSIVSTTSSPKPKVFRLPPVAAAPVKQPKSRSISLLYWGGLLLILALIWPVSYAFSSLSRNVPLGQAAHESLEGILQPPVADAQASVPAEKPPTILLRGQSEAIIGQMAKIPAENEPIVETKAVSKVDNNAGRELLSIISKY
jgi:hypothetical protein